MNGNLIGPTERETTPTRSPRTNSDRKRLIFQAVSLLLAIVALTIHLQYGGMIRTTLATHFHQSAVPKDPVPVPGIPPSQSLSDTPEIQPASPEPMLEEPAVPPTVIEVAVPPPLDRKAIAKAEAALDAASRDRARADARADQAARLFKEASQQAALETSLSKTLAFRVRDPTAQITRTISRGGFLRAEHEKLEKEITALRQAPRAKSTSIVSRTPVSRVAVNEEFHFELRRDRISFINLTQLLNLSKSDAQVRLRLSDRLGVISSKVGPVGDFYLLYVLARSVQGPDDLLDRHTLRYDLRGWELVPVAELRGESYETIWNPVSQFSRALGRISPSSATITLWIYPDSFGLYRRLRDDLAQRGYSVAARPLPDGMAIRGSPSGSLSAAQ